jgi:hypothetical protein
MLAGLDFHGHGTTLYFFSVVQLLLVIIAMDCDCGTRLNVQGCANRRHMPCCLSSLRDGSGRNKCQALNFECVWVSRLAKGSHWKVT